MNPIYLIRSAIVAMLIMLSSAIFTGTLSAEEVAPGDTSATQSVIRDQISAFKESDFDRAFSHAAPNIKRIFGTTDRFISMVQSGYEPLFDPDFYVFGRNIFLYGEIYQEMIVTDRNGKQWQAVYTLKQQEDGSWKITGVKMEPHKGSTT